jgi:hypothetical protein
MRRTVTAATAGFLLMVGQTAATADQPAVPRVGDRVGGRADASSDLGADGAGILVASAMLLTLAVSIATNDDPESC